MEGAMVFETLIDRFPDVRLATGDLRFVGSSALRTLRELPVTLGTDRGATSG
jgi:hypothetical protein